MEISARTKLQTLKDADMTTLHADEDIRSRHVVDQHGDDIGKIDDLLIDEDEHRVRFLQVASGGFLGIGKTRTLIPVEAITSISEDEVRIDQSREHVAGAPDYDPELVDDDYFGSLYGYYGVTPYWGPGYVYPPFPYYGRPDVGVHR